MFKIKLYLLSFFWLFYGDISWSMSAGDVVTADGGAIEGVAPFGWMHQTSNRNEIVLTKEGVYAHSVEASRTLYDALVAKKPLINDDTQIVNLVDYYIVELKKRHAGLELTLVSRELIEVGGNDCVRVHFTFKSPQGLQFDLVAIAFNKGGYLNEVVYSTPRLHLYDRDVEDVNQFMQSVVFK